MDQGKIVLIAGNGQMLHPTPCSSLNIDDEAAMKRFVEEKSEWNDRFEFTAGGVVSIERRSPIEDFMKRLNKVDVNISFKGRRIPRKIKKAMSYCSYSRNTKGRRMAERYMRHNCVKMPDAEMVITREQMGVLEATIKGSSLQYNPDAVTHVSGKDIVKAMAAYVRRR